MDPMGSNADWFLITSLFCSKLNSVKAFIDYNYTVHHTSFNVVLPMNEKLEKGAEKGRHVAMFLKMWGEGIQII